MRVIILSRHENEDYYWRALKMGASGYLLKNAVIAELKDGRCNASSAAKSISAAKSRRVCANTPVAANRPCPQPGGAVELSVSATSSSLLPRAKPPRPSRSNLKLSPKTVEYHRMQLMQRLNIFDIPGLVRFAVRTGLVSQES